MSASKSGSTANHSSPKVSPEICFVYFDVGWLVHPRNIASNLADMKSMGGDSIFTQFVENGDLRWLKLRTRMAHEAGLKVYASPGRVGGLFAAGPIPGSMFATKHADSRMIDRQGQPIMGTGGLMCCPNNPKFQAWFYPFLQNMMLETGADGVAFDEPKGPDIACWCDHCKALVDKPDSQSLLALRESTMADMMGKVCTQMRQHKPDFVTVAMLMPAASNRFLKLVTEQKNLDYIGVDGPLCHQGPTPTADLIKTPLWVSAPHFAAAAHAAGKKSFALTETFDVNPWACGELASRIHDLPAMNIDMYSFNYYGHDCEDGDLVMESVRKAVALVKGK